MTLAVLIFGLSEAASATACLLHRSGWAVVLAADAPPKVHRRCMSFADVWWDGSAVLAGVSSIRLAPDQLVTHGCPIGFVPFVAMEPDEALGILPWAYVIDARLAKRGVPLRLIGRAGVTIGCGPGHVAGETCDYAIETQWGDRLGAVITAGPTAALAGEPRAIEGVGRERIVYAPVAGTLRVLRDIGAAVTAGEIVAMVHDHPITAPVCGTMRGILRNGITVTQGDKLLEVDPRPAGRAVFTGIGQRPAAIAEGVRRAMGIGDVPTAIPGLRSSARPDHPVPTPYQKETLP